MSEIQKPKKKKTAGRKPAKKKPVKKTAETQKPERLKADDSEAIKAVVKRESKPVAISTVNELMTFAEAISKSGMFPGIEDKFQAASVIEYGKEIGLKPIISLQIISVIPTKRGGVLCIEGRALAALAKENGINIKILQKDTDGCKLEFSRADEPAHIASFTREDAKRAGLLSKDNYVKYPEDMFYWRAIARGVKVFDPGLALGLTTAEEIDDMQASIGTISDKQEQPEAKVPTVEIVKSKDQPPEEKEDPGAEPPPEEPEEEEGGEHALDFENTIKEIKMNLEKAEIDERLFKKYLHEELQPLKPERSFVDINQFGHVSFHKGKLDDLKLIIAHFGWITEQFHDSKTFEEAGKETPPGVERDPL